MKLKLLASLLTSFAFSGISYGLTWSDTDSGSPLRFFDTAGETYGESFNITGGSFIPGAVTQAWVTFSFADDEPGAVATPDSGSGSDGLEKVTIYVGGIAVATDLQVDGSHADFAEYTFQLNAAQIADLQNGIIQWDVTRVSGDTYLKIAYLQANNTSVTVPDGGATVALLGLGFLGLVAARKRFGK